jgi:uncharacterized protein
MKLSKSSVGCCVALFFLFTALVQAGEPCNEKAPWPEPELCRNTELSSLDKQLNTAYRQVRSVSPAKQALKQDQRRWLHSVRDVCSDVQCLLKVYRQRLTQLSDRYVDALPITDQPLTNAQAHQACEAIASLAGKDLLASREVPGLPIEFMPTPDDPQSWQLTAQEREAFERELQSVRTMYRLRLTANASPERFVTYLASGTYTTIPTIAAKFADSQEDAIEQVSDTQDEIRWAVLGGWQYPVIIAKRVFLVTTQMPDPNALGMVSALTPEGRSRPLCMAEPQAETLVVTQAKTPELCSRIADGRLKPLEWENQDEALHDRFFDGNIGGSVGHVGVLEMDLDGDGHREKIARVLYDISAGGGGEEAMLKQLSDGPPGSDKTILEEGRVHVQRAKLNIYSWKGGHYISVFDTIVRLKGDETENICSFKRLVSRKITTFFDVTQ